MKIKLKSVKTHKSGTEYITLKIPKKIYKQFPEGYFFIDLEIKDVRRDKNADRN